MNALFSLCGYDLELVDKVGVGERRFFILSATVSVLAVGLAGAGMAYGCVLTVGTAAAPVGFVVAALFVLNLLRLQHAGTGFPVHMPIEAIHEWRPAMTGVVVLLTLGALIVQPLVFLAEKPLLDDVVAVRADEAAAIRTALGIQDVTPPVTDGLVARGRAAWDGHAGLSALLTVLFALIIAGPALLRRLGATVVQQYESERWITDRILVDDEWAWAREVVENTLRHTAPGFRPPLQVPYADPPYNTRALVFGLDPDTFVEGRVKFTRQSRKRAGVTPVVPVPVEPWWDSVSQSLASRPPMTTTLPAPMTTTTPLVQATTTTPPTATVRATPTPTSTLSPPGAQPATIPAPALAPAPPSAPADVPAPAQASTTAATLTAPEVGRMRVEDARRSPQVMALCAFYLDLGAGEVLSALQAADANAAVHTVFAGWNKLGVILLKRTDVAIALGLAPLIAIAVGRPAEQVERRLRAAPPESKVSSVFAPELARRLLRDKKPG